ncbi:hypothetical protein ACRZ9H_004559, partial [Escherichia coli O51:H10]|nr:hypothetical protein [Escherichia coli]ELX1912815.1 hypothetical protein [Escherichia coli]
MEMLGKILVIIISMIIISCDYYNTGMDYQDNIALEQVVTWDSDNIFTPNIFEHNGRCFMKKNETWMLLNGDATPNIRTMSNKKIECLEKSEVEWASRVCDSITDKERENLKAL